MLTGFWPPASLMRSRFVDGVGPASMMSRSMGAWWDRPLSLAVTFVILPDSPDTVTCDG